MSSLRRRSKSEELLGRARESAPLDYVWSDNWNLNWLSWRQNRLLKGVELDADENQERETNKFRRKQELACCPHPRRPTTMSFKRTVNKYSANNRCSYSYSVDRYLGRVGSTEAEFSRIVADGKKDPLLFEETSAPTSKLQKRDFKHTVKPIRGRSSVIEILLITSLDSQQDLQ